MFPFAVAYRHAQWSLASLPIVPLAAIRGDRVHYASLVDRGRESQKRKGLP
jgi:hypothetical protein